VFRVISAPYGTGTIGTGNGKDGVENTGDIGACSLKEVPKEDKSDENRSNELEDAGKGLEGVENASEGTVKASNGFIVVGGEEKESNPPPTGVLEGGKEGGIENASNDFWGLSCLSNGLTSDPLTVVGISFIEEAFDDCTV
jgi:hypothetical protein